MASKDLWRLVARMSFDDGFTIPEIAAHIARSGDKKHGTVKSVSRLLAEASQWLLKRDKALADYEAEIIDYALGNEVRQKYPVLQNVLVARSVPTTPDAPWEPILDLTQSRLAAQYFDGLTENENDEMRVAVSGSELLLDMATAMPHHQRQHVHYYASAMIGRGRMLRATHIGPDTNAMLCWIQSGMISGNLHYASVAPPELSFEEGKPDAARHSKAKRDLTENVELYAENSFLKPVLRDLGEVNMVISDIGAFSPAGPQPRPSPEMMSVPSLLREYGVSPKLLAEEGAVGHMSYAIFDENGESRDHWRFFLNVGYPDTVGFFRNLVGQKKKVIVVAECSSDPALRAALRGGLFNVLITDDATAHFLLAAAPPRFRVPPKYKPK
jgi:DNA-binding transcriptional regulator LsrR (DeoR family)